MARFIRDRAALRLRWLCGHSRSQSERGTRGLHLILLDHVQLLHHRRAVRVLERSAHAEAGVSHRRKRDHGIHHHPAARLDGLGVHLCTGYLR